MGLSSSIAHSWDTETPEEVEEEVVMATIKRGLKAGMCVCVGYGINCVSQGG